MPENKKTITDFRELPDPVKGWLSSTQITYLVSDLNRRLGFSEEEKMVVIPTLILRLAISDMSPEMFVSELSRLLDISPSAAKALAQEIEEKMLRPIELVLRNELGIDVKLIHFAKEASMEQPATMPAAPTAPAPTLIASPEVAHPEESRPTPTSQATQPTSVPIRVAPIPPSIPPTVSPVQPKAAGDLSKETPVPFRVAKIPTWGPPTAPPPPETSS